MKRPAHRFPILVILAMFSTWLYAKAPDCTNPDSWPAGMAFAQLKNAGVLDHDVIDIKKTEVKRIASERIGKNLYRQVHLVHFIKTASERITAITVNEVSSEECSMSGVDVYLVSKPLGDYTPSGK